MFIHHDYELYDTQHDFVTARQHFTALLGGIGSGKSIAGAARAVGLAMDSLNGVHVTLPNTGMITAPTYNILRDATIPAFREVAGELIKHITTTPPIHATLVNGSYIMFRSAHQPELLRGPSITWWWGDEAALYHRNVWRIMIGRLRQGGRLGYAWLTTTPKGRNWIYQEFVHRPYHSASSLALRANLLGAEEPEARYAFFRARTRDNLFIDPDYYNMLAESYSGDFARQELDGDFVAFEGLIYAAFDRATHIRSNTYSSPPLYEVGRGSGGGDIVGAIHESPSISPRPFVGEGVRGFPRTIAGVDWGYANPGVIVIYGIDADGRMWGLHEEYARRRRIEEWATLAAQLQARYNVETFYCDPSEPDFIAQFQQAGVHAVPANNDVLPGIQAVQNRLVVQSDGLPRLILSPEFVHTAAEFEQYQWLENPDGLRDVPKKVNDHALDATRYACMGVGEYVDVGGAMSYAD